MSEHTAYQPTQAIAATPGSDTKGYENLLWELVGALDVADATDASKKPIVAEYAMRIASTLGVGKLTAEQVREAIFENSSSDTLKRRMFKEDDWQAIADDLNAALGGEINGDTSDGYHTFNELYHHRAVLFSVVVAANSGRAWKSKLHYDGTMYEGMFIVGVDTPQGQATYHYDVEPYWDMFWCRELERAPEWDGHTSDDAIERIGSLRDVVLKGPKGRR